MNSHFELEELKREDKNRGKMLGTVIIALFVVAWFLLLWWGVSLIRRPGTTKQIDPTTGFNRPYYSASYEEDYLDASAER